MNERASHRASLATFVLVGAVLVAGAVSFVEDWDGGGFALACDGVDLARFRPHPPGYPLFALIARTLGALGVHAAQCAPWLARTSAVGLALFAASLATILRGAWPARALAASLAALSLAGTWRVSTMLSPMALALGLLGLAIARSQPTRSSALQAGLPLGLALCARPSDAVPMLAVLLACAGRSWRALPSLAVAATVAGVAHGALALHTGALRYLALLRTHAETHGERAAHARSWTESLRALGGYAIEQPSTLGALFALAYAALAIASLPADARRKRSLLAALACALWSVFAQPAPVERHWLWLAALGAIALARRWTIAPHTWVSRLSIALACVGAIVGARTTLVRHHTRPAPVAIAEFVRLQGGVLFGTRATRPAEVLGVQTYVAAHTGEVRAIAERLPRWPTELWITSEVAPWPARAARREQEFCGPRSARGEPRCLRVRAFDLAAESDRSHR